MRLPPYSGPYPVGAVDIEVPVRKPRDFIPDYVDPVKVNKVVKNGKKININDGKKLSAKLRKAREADKGTGDNTQQKLFTDEAFKAGYRLRSTTLFFRTVLFTLYYPSVNLSGDERRKYGHVRWIGRCVFC